MNDLQCFPISPDKAMLISEHSSPPLYIMPSLGGWSYGPEQELPLVDAFYKNL